MEQSINHADYRRRGLRRHVVGGIVGIIVGLGFSHAAHADSWSESLRAACGNDTSRLVHPFPSSPELTARCYDAAAHHWRIGQVMQKSPLTPQGRYERNAWTCHYERAEKARQVVGFNSSPSYYCHTYALGLERERSQ